MQVFISHTREAGADEAGRLTSALQAQLGGDQVLASGGEDRIADQLIARSETFVALIGPGWAASEDAFARECAAALGRRIPVIVVLARDASLPSREELPAALKPLLDHHPALTLQVPTDFYWDVWISRLARWLKQIDDERRRRAKVHQDAQDARAKLEQELARARQQVADGERAVSEWATRRDRADTAVQSAAETTAARQKDVDPGRAGGGARVFLSYGAETSGDARKLESDLKERLERAVIYSTEPIPEGADSEQTIEQRIARCDVLLAVLGPEWLASTDGGATRTATAPKLEVGQALRRGLPVIAVLTQSAPRPQKAELPDDLKALAEQPAVELLVQFWAEGVDQLIARVRQTEQELLRRDRSLQEASDQLRAAEREASKSRTAHDKAITGLERARGKVAELEQRLTRAREEQERLGQEREDQNRAFLDGPPSMQPDAPRRPQPSRQMIAVGVAIVVLIIIILIAAH